MIRAQGVEEDHQDVVSSAFECRGLRSGCNRAFDPRLIPTQGLLRSLGGELQFEDDQLAGPFREVGLYVFRCLVEGRAGGLFDQYRLFQAVIDEGDADLARAAILGRSGELLCCNEFSFEGNRKAKGHCAARTLKDGSAIHLWRNRGGDVYIFYNSYSTGCGELQTLDEVDLGFAWGRERVATSDRRDPYEHATEQWDHTASPRGGAEAGHDPRSVASRGRQASPGLWIATLLPIGCDQDF